MSLVVSNYLYVFGLAASRLSRNSSRLIHLARLPKLYRCTRLAELGCTLHESLYALLLALYMTFARIVLCIAACTTYAVVLGTNRCMHQPRAQYICARIVLCNAAGSSARIAECMSAIYMCTNRCMHCSLHYALYALALGTNRCVVLKYRYSRLLLKSLPVRLASS